MIENLFEIGLDKLLVARRNGDQLILGYIEVQDEKLGFSTQFQNISIDGSLSPIGALSSPLNSCLWDSLTFYGAAYMQTELSSAASAPLQAIHTNDGATVWQAINSYYKAYEFLLSINITPIIIDQWSDVLPPTENGLQAKLRGPIVCNLPLANKKAEVHGYLQQKIKEELRTIRVRERDCTEQEMLKLFKDYL